LNFFGNVTYFEINISLSFDIGLKQTCSENNSSDSHGWVWISIENFCSNFGENVK
jgi:hypothetical protein